MMRPCPQGYFDLFFFRNPIFFLDIFFSLSEVCTCSLFFWYFLEELRSLLTAILGCSPCGEVCVSAQFGEGRFRLENGGPAPSPLLKRWGVLGLPGSGG